MPTASTSRDKSTGCRAEFEFEAFLDCDRGVTSRRMGAVEGWVGDNLSTTVSQREKETAGLRDGALVPVDVTPIRTATCKPQL